MLSNIQAYLEHVAFKCIASCLALLYWNLLTVTRFFKGREDKRNLEKFKEELDIF